MKKAILVAAAALLLASPAYAQFRLNASSARSASNPTMIKIPPSSRLGMGLSGASASPNKSMYPSPIRQEYNPVAIDPTARNPNLRQR
jgi:hypothetical protein